MLRIQGTFLRSRVARRTFWVLLASAVLPMALFATMALQAHLTQQREDHRAAETEYLKHIGLRAYDRLNAARAVLAALTAESSANDPDSNDPAVRALLAGVATEMADGQRHGDLRVLEALQRTGADKGRADRTLWWLPRDAGGPGRVFITSHDAGTGVRWVAEVARDFLWADFGADGPAATMCLSDAAKHLLRCPQAADADAPTWSLFMKAGFGSPDWVLYGRRPSAADHGLDGVLAVGVGAGVVSLLLITVLGLVLVRRTMVPLEELTEGTRRLAAGDWSARVDEARPDEFGLLGRQFNAMVSRLGRQVKALGVQSDIDREILGGLDIDRLMGRVVDRLQALMPGSDVAVVARRPDGLDWSSHRVGGAHRLQHEPGAEADRALDDELAVHCVPDQVPDGWLREALSLTDSFPRQTCWVPARWHGETVALLVTSARQRPPIDNEARQEIEALRDRCAVAIAAAQREHRLVSRAMHDDLTGLLNRHGLHDACDRLLVADHGQPAPFALLFIDLDGFKEVNDAMGHSTGDQLLRAVADRLRQALPPGAQISRPGGDEFIVLLPGQDAGAVAGEVAQQISRVAQPFMLKGQAQHIGASVGVAVCPDDGVVREELLRRADLAMYAAKADGRGRWRRYAEVMDQEASERAWIQRDLRTALSNGNLEVHYQPRLDLRSGRTCGAEALVRWRHPVHGLIPPVRFIPVAEESDLIIALGDRVMDLALAQRRRWRDAGLPVERVAVNVSARQLQDEQFASRTLAMLVRHGLQPGDLEIEITESLFAGDGATVERALAPLRARGVQVALDDFGTGYSSLSALRRLPVDVMKIDRSFVIELGEDRGAEAVVRSVITLARELGKRIVAEGVETVEQQQHLRLLGCDEVQGYRYAKPLPAEDFMQGARAGFDAPLRALAAARPVATPA